FRQAGRGGARQRRWRRTWVNPPVSVPENQRGPFPKLLLQVKSNAVGVDVRYALAGEGADRQPTGLFVVDAATGRVSVTASLDREVIAQYRLRCFAVDPTGGFVEDPVDIVIDVIDVNDNRPKFTRDVFHGSLTEGSPRGTFVMRVEASDLDDPLTPHGALRYDIRVARFSLVVMASDMEGDARISLSTTATAIITITDINDHAPEFTSRTWTGTVRENAVGVPVTMALLSVIDADEVGTAAWRVRYSLRGGDPQDLFAVETDPATNDGRIVVVKPLDFEMASSYKLIVVVDNEEPLVKSAWTPPQSTATVTVSVEDENEAPLFERGLQQVRLSEGVALGSVVTTLVARDPDSAQKQSCGLPEAEDAAAVGEPETAEDGIEQPGPDASTPQQPEDGEPSTEGLRQAHAKLAELLYAAATMLDHITQLGAAGPLRGDDSRRPQRLPPFRRSTTLKFPPSPQLLLRVWLA
ncbi:LOW QUALITY PROTEIN: cadherin-4-like, partial [Lethenteron reissneri]|uniref:LOW QUALITY PROTEIN: cadherin-4-like n=1 Tax=Lethenteron reissneri TaxID=7753 RepID=UPI002AB62C6F